MATFVLVHGGWSGAHGFRHVRRLLQQAGHEVFTPSLTGIGERVHLASPLVNLSTHRTIKAWMGYSHFLMRQLKNVRTEMSLHVLAYNLRRMISIMGVAALMTALRA